VITNAGSSLRRSSEYWQVAWDIANNEGCRYGARLYELMREQEHKYLRESCHRKYREVYATPAAADEVLPAPI